MTTFIVTSFLNRPQIITKPGEYLTRCGEIVTIKGISEKRGSLGWQMAWGSYADGINESWEVCGAILPSQQTQNDIVSAA